MKFDITDPFVFEMKEINGVPLYYKHLPWSPCTYISIGFRVGSLNDLKGKDGLSHFLEHSVLQTSKTYPTRIASRDFKKRYTLKTLNASTGYWRTNYTAKCLPENFQKTFSGLWEFANEPLLKPEEVELEKNIITQEMWNRFRNDKYIAYLKEHVKITKPNLKSNRMTSAAGWIDTVATINHSDLVEWHAAHYHAGNMYVFLVGNITPEILAEATSLISTAKKGTALPPIERTPDVQKPLLAEKTFNSEEIGFPQNHATLSITRNITHDIANEEILRLAEAVLRSLLFEVLREEMGLCYGVSVGCSSQVDHISNFISLNLKADQTDAAKEKMFQLISEFSISKYEEKFNQEKQIALDQLRSVERTSASIINDAEAMLMYDDRIIPLTETLSEIEKVTFEETSKYILETFKRSDVYVETILP